MKHRREDLEKFIEESRSSQRNTVFPDTVRNARSVDAFLWRGSPDPPLVQRIGAWLFGLTFIAMGLFGLWASFVTDRDYPWIFGLVSIPCVALGIRSFRNGFSRGYRSPK
jgi:hypothetical protein